MERHCQKGHNSDVSSGFQHECNHSTCLLAAPARLPGFCPWLGCGVGLHLKTSDQGGSLNHRPLTVPLIPWQPVIPKLALAARTPAHAASLPALSPSSISGSQQFWGAAVLSPTSPLALGLICGGSGWYMPWSGFCLAQLMCCLQSTIGLFLIH